MPSDSIAGFLDRAQASRVLFPEQVEQLIRQPDIPHSDLSSLCTYLLSRGVLTQFQANALRNGRGDALSFGGYPVLDVIGPCRGGTAYQALHPSLRTPLVLRRFDPSAFAPTDNPHAVVQRTRTYGTIQHANLLPVIDAGEYQGEAYAVIEQPSDSADLASLLKEVGGAMPGFLAAEYGWAVASALRAIHERGGWHGEVRPGVLLVGPLTTKTNPDGTTRRRPAPNASVKLTETGLVPISPPAAQQPPDIAILAYLPPERIDGNVYDARGDIYGLGASLYLLLTGRPAFAGEIPADVMNRIRTTEPIPLGSLRPDVPAELAAIVMKMLAKSPEARPQTAFEVCQALAPFCRPGTLPVMSPPAPAPQAIPQVVAHAVSVAQSVPQVVPHAVPAAVPVVTAASAESEPDGWGVNPNAFAEAQAASTADTTPKRRRQLTEAEKSRSKLWIALGLCLHLSAVTLLIAYLAGAFNSTPAPAPSPEPKEKKNDTQPKKNKRPAKDKKNDDKKNDLDPN